MFKRYDHGYEDGYGEGYRAGKRVADADLYAQGYQDAFNHLREQIECFLEEQANSPIPSRINQPT